MLFIRKVTKSSLVFFALISSPLSNAHHSFAATFTEQVITVEGIVESYKFVNPHVLIYFNVLDENGIETEWVTEGLAATSLRRRGWDRDSIKIGDSIRVTGNSTRNGSPMVSIGKLEFIDASGAVTGSPEQGASEVIAGLSTTSIARMQLDDGRPNLSGTWRRLTHGRPDDPTGAPFNQVGAELQAVFDPIIDPQVQCEPPGLVRQAAATPHPVRLTQHDDHIVIAYEEYGSVRTIYFDDRSYNVESELSHLGTSKAYYDDQKLIVETTGLLANLSGTNGNALSNQTSTVETYFRNADGENGSSLTMQMVITDPGHLTAPWVLSWRKYFDQDHEFIEVDCEVPLGY